MIQRLGFLSAAMTDRIGMKAKPSRGSSTIGGATHPPTPGRQCPNQTYVSAIREIEGIRASKTAKDAIPIIIPATLGCRHRDFIA
jgi:hypothetical protein